MSPQRRRTRSPPPHKGRRISATACAAEPHTLPWRPSENRKTVFRTSRIRVFTSLKLRFQTASVPSRLRGRVRVGAVAASAALAGGKAVWQTATPSPALPRAGAGEGAGLRRILRFQTAFSVCPTASRVIPRRVCRPKGDARVPRRRAKAVQSLQPRARQSRTPYTDCQRETMQKAV
ncbi:hypothetical protein [Kingella potus]|uniref:hypothetical protein n=1 Tax=Kingella potus TaxID=265175 RepID=UPI001FD58AAC|nr:hypothetical protein [Kingella potus]UOP00786.1 hypothetical protein LVJ84_13695 [Kingella potus]